MEQALNQVLQFTEKLELMGNGYTLNLWIFPKSIGGFHPLTPKIGGIWGIEKVIIIQV